MPLTVVDEPLDRPLWIAETIRLTTAASERGRSELLTLVAMAGDADLGRGTDDRWGLGQVATHLLIVERGVASIVLRLALGEMPGATGQPRPTPGANREGIAALAAKADAAL